MMRLRFGSARLLLAAPLLVVLAGCAAGSPSVLPNRTATAQAIAANTAAAPTETPIPMPTATLAPSSTAALAPTPTESPQASPTLEPTATDRPQPPVENGASTSQIFHHGDGSRPRIALTFDAGDDTGHTAAILDALKAAGVKGTFGVTGEWAKANPGLVKRMVDEGHMLINHTWDHRSFTGESTSPSEAVLDSADRVKELKETEQEIESLTGYDTAPYFRPPFGDYDDGVLTDLASAGYTVTVMWSCDTLGWNGATVDEIMVRCVDHAQAGDIILMHVGKVSADADALPGMIKSLENQGFELVTVEELLSPS